MVVSTSRWETNTATTWYAGSINGSYNGCGWMRTGDLNGSSGSASSSCGARDYCDFIYCDASGQWTYGDKYDGQVANAIGGCQEFANYRPWSSAGTPADVIKYTTPGNTLRVRYRAKYTYNGHRYFMVRDITTPSESNQANWVFIADNCMS